MIDCHFATELDVISNRVGLCAMAKLEQIAASVKGSIVRTHSLYHSMVSTSPSNVTGFINITETLDMAYIGCRPNGQD